MSSRSLAITLIFAMFTACQPLAPPKPPLLQTVAVLPFDNESNDINAPDIMQSYVYWALKGSPYQVRDIKETNEQLAKNGVVDGGQLPVMDPVKIAKDLGVQGLIYGYISDFGYVNILGYYRSRKAGLDLKMIDGTTGQRINPAMFVNQINDLSPPTIGGVTDSGASLKACAASTGGCSILRTCGRATLTSFRSTTRHSLGVCVRYPSSPLC